MHRSAQGNGDHSFLIGLLAGTAIGAGLAMLLGPRVVSGSGGLTRKRQAVLGEARPAAAGGARTVKRLATVTGTGRVHDIKRRRAADGRARRS
jgi:hypothetical protein